MRASNDDRALDTDAVRPRIPAPAPSASMKEPGAAASRSRIPSPLRPSAPSRMAGATRGESSILSNALLAKRETRLPNTLAQPPGVGGLQPDVGGHAGDRSHQRDQDRDVRRSSAAPSGTPAWQASTAPDSKTRSLSNGRSGLGAKPGEARETRSSILRRSLSVGKGRAAATSAEPAQPGMRPPSAAAPGGSILRNSIDRRDGSAGRRRPGSAREIGKPAGAAVGVAVGGGGAGTSSTATPSRPAFALNLSALKQPKQPSPPPQELATSTRTAASEEPPVPKLNLGGILAARAEEQAAEPIFIPQPTSASQPDKRKTSSRQPSAKEEQEEHFYVYPSVNPAEKKQIDDVCRGLPKKQQVAVNTLYSKMVEARLNCEQMAFRGHRLLDQAQSEFKNRLAAKDEETERWRQEVEFLRSQLGALLASQQQSGQGQDADGGSENVAEQLLKGLSLMSDRGQADAQEEQGAEVGEQPADMPPNDCAE